MMQGSKHALRRLTRPKFRHIVRRSDVWGGKAVVAGTRIPLFLLAARLQSGWTEAKILDEYPRLTSGSVRAVIRYIARFSPRIAADRQAYEWSLPR